MNRLGRVIAIVGAESTGKTMLAQALRDQLRSPTQQVALVGEVLREFCDARQRTPRAEEQAAIAREQTRRIVEAVQGHQLVIADTTALMPAIYSQLLFADHSLLADALAEQARFDVTLLTALDLPWVADGRQRDGPQVRAPVDALLRQALASAGIGFAVVSGHAALRSANAVRAIDAALRPTPPPGAARWRAGCAECGDPQCERHLLAR